MNRIKFDDFCPLTDLEHLNETLEEYGVAVLPNVLTDEECETYKKRIFDHLADVLNVREPDDFYEKLKPLRGGILGAYGVALMKPVLDLKTNDKVIEPFKKIWNEEELTTSLDGINIYPPPERTKSKKFFNENDVWFHMDQSSDKRYKCCIQSFVNLEPIEHGDSCLSVLLYSNKYFTQFLDHFQIDSKGRDYYKINTTTHYDWYVSNGCEWKTIMAPKGSMVFWDSRTIHMGTSPREDRPNKDRFRFIAYVCYAPAKWQTDKDRETLKTAYIENRSTNHWPYTVIANPKPSDDQVYNNLDNLEQRHKKFLGLLN